MASSNLNPILAALQPSAAPSQPSAPSMSQPTSGVDDHEMFQPAENGPFRCDHCEYYQNAGQCSEPHMVAKYGDDTGNGATTAGGQVSDGSCCDYYSSVDGQGS